MSYRSAVARDHTLQPEFFRRDPIDGAVFRFAVPVLRVRDVLTTVAWYREHLGFSAELFPERSPHEFAVLERDGVQLLVRGGAISRRQPDGHTGWDLYLWVDGADFARLETSVALTGAIVRAQSTMGASMHEIEVRDPDGYVLCIGGPTRATITRA